MAAPKFWKKDIVLQAIKRRDGMTFGQVQQLVILMAGHDPEELDSQGLRAYRGFWSTTLAKLLKKHCVRGPDRKYRIHQAGDRPSTIELRAMPGIIRMYEAERRLAVKQGRTPPGPIEETTVKANWSREGKSVYLKFSDGGGTFDRRQLVMRFSWPLTSDATGQVSPMPEAELEADNLAS